MKWPCQVGELKLRAVDDVDHDAEQLPAREVGQEVDGEGEGGQGHEAAVQLVLNHLETVLEQLVPHGLTQPVPGSSLQRGHGVRCVNPSPRA